MAGAIAQGVIFKISAAEEAAVVSDFTRFEWFKKRLREISGGLKYADSRSTQDEDVKEWLHNVRDAAWDVEDIVEECAVHPLYITDSCVCNPDELLFRYRMGKRIEEVKERIISIGELKFSSEEPEEEPESSTSRTAGYSETPESSTSSTAGYSEMPSSSTSSTARYSETPSSSTVGRTVCKSSSLLPSDSRPVAIEPKIQHLMSLLDKPTLPIIAVVGMGGAGKTFLLQNLFDRIKNRYEHSIWLAISKSYSVHKLQCHLASHMGNLMDVVKHVTEERAAHLIHYSLLRTRSLIVLDDVWRVAREDNIIRRLGLPMGSNRECKIVVTTRNREVCQNLGAFLYQMELLSEQESWQLFCAHAFGGDLPPYHLQVVASQVEKQCGRLPMALKAIGAFLSGCTEINQWKAKLRQLIEGIDLHRDPVGNILRLSYDSLPAAVKPCFSYLSFFPVDEEIDCEYLIDLWIAEGFIPQGEDQRDIAWGYLYQLANLCLVEVREDDHLIKYCKIHVLLLDLAIYISKENRCTFAVTNAFTSVKRILLAKKELDDMVIARSRASCHRSLRTLSLSKNPIEKIEANFFSPMRLLRVLDLSETKIFTLPHCVGKLKLLKLLNLSSTRIKKVPICVRSLKSLIFLDLDRCQQLQTLPKWISELRCLQHLKIRNCYDELRSHMPKGISELVSLRVLRSDPLSLSVEDDGLLKLKDVAKLTCLQELSLEVKHEKELKSIHDGILAQLFKIRHLSLKSHFSTESHLPENMAALADLQILYLRKFAVPSWVCILTNLRQLLLYDCHCSDYPALETMPNLIELVLDGNERCREVPKAFVKSSGFPVLRFLTIMNFPLLEVWPDLEDGAMAVLEKFYLGSCPRVKKVPERLERLRRPQQFYRGITGTDADLSQPFQQEAIDIAGPSSFSSPQLSSPQHGITGTNVDLSQPSKQEAIDITGPSSFSSPQLSSPQRGITRTDVDLSKPSKQEAIDITGPSSLSSPQPSSPQRGITGTDVDLSQPSQQEDIDIAGPSSFSSPQPCRQEDIAENFTFSSPLQPSQQQTIAGAFTFSSSLQPSQQQTISGPSTITETDFMGLLKKFYNISQLNDLIQFIDKLLKNMSGEKSEVTSASPYIKDGQAFMEIIEKRIDGLNDKQNLTDSVTAEIEKVVMELFKGAEKIHLVSAALAVVGFALAILSQMSKTYAECFELLKDMFKLGKQILQLNDQMPDQKRILNEAVQCIVVGCTMCVSQSGTKNIFRFLTAAVNAASLQDFRDKINRLSADVIMLCVTEKLSRQPMFVPQSEEFYAYQPDDRGKEISEQKTLLDIPPSSLGKLESLQPIVPYKHDKSLELPEGQAFVEYKPQSNKVSVQMEKHLIFLICYEWEGIKTIVDKLVKSLSAGGVTVIVIELLHWEMAGKKDFSLKQVSEGTDIHIPIFSKEQYLRHLEQWLCICRPKSIIRPLFYDTNEDIKYQCDETLNKLAPPQASFLPGWSLLDYRTEWELVKRVVFDILEMLNNLPLPLPLNAVGLEERMKDLIGKLEMESDRLKMVVAIRGMGGIGKTTLAKAIFNSIGPRFQACSFVASVKAKELCKLQEQILKDLSRQDILVKSVEHGKALMKAHLGSIRALVILDDIDHSRQLEALRVDWLAPGSRLLLIFRNTELLTFAHAVEIHDMDPLGFEQSVELFSWHAFLRTYPDDGYEDRSKEIAKDCRGIPLLLEVAGASLYGRMETGDWDYFIRHLKNTIDQDIHRRLCVSTKVLSDQEIEIFLDIACFFVGKENLETALRFWEAIGHTPNKALEKLIQNSLVTIDDKNQFIMHDLLQDMVRAMVADRSPDLGERSRLWRPEDAEQVTKGLGTMSVQGFSISGVERSNIVLQEESFAPMTNLQLLWIAGEVEKADFLNLCPGLRWLRWNSSPLRCLPSEWSVKHLTVLDLSSGIRTSSSELREFWNERSLYKEFENLNVLRLTSAQYLERLPDFSIFPALTVLDLEDCPKLTDIPDSIGLLKGLKCLNLSRCRNLVKLPDGISKLSSLEKLLLSHCSLLEELPNFGKLDKLEKLILAGCLSIRFLPNPIGELSNLKELDIQFLGLIQELPSLGKLSCLKKLILSGCESLRNIPTSIGELRCLQYLEMNKCRSIDCLPEKFGDLDHLEELYMNDCPRFYMLPSGFGNLVNLRILELTHNTNLMQLPPSFSKLPSLMWFDASDCNLLDGLHEGIGDLLPLGFLNLEKNIFCQLPPSICKLTNLTKLNLNNCQYLEELPTLPQGIVELDVGNCTQLIRLPSMSDLKRLTCLILCNCENLIGLPELSPCQCLVVLNISRCLNIRSLAGVEGLNSLKTLYFGGSGVSVLELNQHIQDMPQLEEVCIYANGVPQRLELKTGDHCLNDDFTDIPGYSVENNDKCGGVLLFFVVNFMHEYYTSGSPSQNSMDLAIIADNQEAIWVTIFSNRQNVEGDQLYICMYRETHLLVKRMRAAKSISVRAKGRNVQIRECGMQPLYNGIGDENFKSLVEDLSSLAKSYTSKTSKDEVDALEDDILHKTREEESDGDLYDYGYASSEGEYRTDED